jgi:hypothetical protein
MGEIVRIGNVIGSVGYFLVSPKWLIIVINFA